MPDRFMYQISNSSSPEGSCPICQAWDGRTATRREDLPPGPNPDCFRADSCGCLVIQIESGPPGGEPGGDDGQPDPQPYAPGVEPPTDPWDFPDICSYEYTVDIEGIEVEAGVAYYVCDEGRR